MRQHQRDVGLRQHRVSFPGAVGPGVPHGSGQAFHKASSSRCGLIVGRRLGRQPVLNSLTCQCRASQVQKVPTCGAHEAWRRRRNRAWFGNRGQILHRPCNAGHYAAPLQRRRPVHRLGRGYRRIIADKQSDMGPRTARRGLTLRLLSAGRCGYATAGPRGCALAIAVALPVACCASLVRRRENSSGWDGYVEDALAIAVAALAAHSINYPSPRLEAEARNFLVASFMKLLASMRLTPSLCALSDSDSKVLMSGTRIRAVAVISIVPWLLLVATSCSTSSSPPAQTLEVRSPCAANTTP